MRKLQYKNGELINGLKFIKELDTVIMSGRFIRKALFECYCGRQFETGISYIRSKDTRSCGCRKTMALQNRATHGQYKNQLYSVWADEKTRCLNHNSNNFHNYGERGIAISDEFKNDFYNWYVYVSSLPLFEIREELNLTIDRINNDGNYERGNLRWATKSEQVRNQRPRKKYKKYTRKPKNHEATEF